MTPAQRNRLYITAQHVLHNVEDDRLVLYDWEARPGTALPNCGFAGCVVGHACQIPALKSEGLRLGPGYIYPRPEYDGHTGWAAVNAFYGLSQEEAIRLFDSGSYRRDPTTIEVAERIMDFLTAKSLAPGDERTIRE